MPTPSDVRAALIITAGAIKNRRLLRRVQAIDQLSKRDQEALLRNINAFLSKAN
jgi:hypothetical protein